MRQSHSAPTTPEPFHFLQESSRKDQRASNEGPHSKLHDESVRYDRGIHGNITAKTHNFSSRKESHRDQSYERDNKPEESHLTTQHNHEQIQISRDISNLSNFEPDDKLKDAILSQLKALEEIPLPSETAALTMSFDVHSTLGIEWQKIKTPSFKPATRSDVVHLEKWMNESVERCIDPKTGKTSSAHLQSIYSIVFYELIRQTSLQCIERGMLMSKVWRKYISFTYGLLLEHEIMREKFLTMLDISARYSQSVPRYVNQIDQLEKQNKLLEDQLDALRKENTALEHTQFQLHQDLQNLRKTVVALSHEQQTRQFLHDAGFCINSNGTIVSIADGEEESTDDQDGDSRSNQNSHMQAEIQVDTAALLGLKTADCQAAIETSSVSTQTASNTTHHRRGSLVGSSPGDAPERHSPSPQKETNPQPLALAGLLGAGQAMMKSQKTSIALFADESNDYQDKATDTFDMIRTGLVECAIQTDRIQLATLELGGGFVSGDGYAGSHAGYSSARGVATMPVNRLQGRDGGGAPGIPALNRIKTGAGAGVGGLGSARKRGSIVNLVQTNPLADMLIPASRSIPLTDQLKSLYWIMRTVHELYQEKIRIDGYEMTCDNPWISKRDSTFSMFDFVFETFLQKHSRRTVAEKEMMELLASTNYHRHSSPKISFFGIMLGLIPGCPAPSSIDLYFYSIAYFNRKASEFKFTDADHVIPFVSITSAMDFCKEMLTLEIPEHLLKFCYAEMKTAGRSVDRSDVDYVKLDEFLGMIVRIRERSLEFNVELVRKLFIAGDLNANAKLSWEEFRTMISCFDPMKTKNEVLSMFRKVVEQGGDDDDFDLDQFIATARAHSFFIRVPNVAEMLKVMETIPDKDFTSVLQTYMLKLWAADRANVEVKFVAALQNPDRERVSGLKERMTIFRKRLDEMSSNQGDSVVVWMSYRMLLYEISQMMRLSEATTNSIRSWLQSK
eukprot:TRINITY_DN10011_c0_g1_i6.p1 TRINITY_DN10011_c0_g1~~TRINITY_DN10011_c0_g1_i6.p1  ORF type:complete len:959 (-),score=193.69 TRINITY_DN10011_c0_g1_i6:401-3277(-)